MTPDPLAAIAPAKVNLTLRVIRRRPDGYHELESLVAFADYGDRLELTPGDSLSLSVHGPGAAQVGGGPDNLVIRAANALRALIPGLRLGAFALEKRLPVAAGLGGGSADAAAALRLLAHLNGIAAGDPFLLAVARAVGADVPVCLESAARLMRGIGEILSPPLPLSPLPAVLVNPGIELSTRAVFAAWKPAAPPAAPFDETAFARCVSRDEVLGFLAGQTNDLEPAAIVLAPVIASTLDKLRGLAGARLARMSGSGATCFVLFGSAAEAIAAGKELQAAQPDWWVRVAALGGAMP